MSVALEVTRVASTWAACARDPRGCGVDLLLATAVAQHRAREFLLGGVLMTLAQGTHPFESEAERGSGHGPVLDRPRAALSRAGRLSYSRGSAGRSGRNDHYVDVSTQGMG